MTPAEQAAATILRRFGNNNAAQLASLAAAAFQLIQGPAFKINEFVENVGSFQINRINHTNDNGFAIPRGAAPAATSSPGALIKFADVAAYTDRTWQIAAPSDRFRLVLGMKIAIFPIVDATDVVGTQAILISGYMQQLMGLGRLEVIRQRGQAINGSLSQWLSGTNKQAPVASDMAILGVLANDVVPSEAAILPHGLQAGMGMPIDALNPMERCSFRFNGMNGLAMVTTAANGLLAAVDAIVLDCIKSGQ